MDFSQELFDSGVFDYGFGSFFAVSLGLVALVERLSTELAVTDRRIVYKTGLIKRNTMEQQLQRVDSVSINQSIFGRLLGYGDVEIRGSGNSFTPTHKIASPLEFRKAVQYAIDGA